MGIGHALRGWRLEAFASRLEVGGALRPGGILVYRIYNRVNFDTDKINFRLHGLRIPLGMLEV